MTIPKDNGKLDKARHLRREMTWEERKLWYLYLRDYPVKIYKQRIIGQYIVDFYCAAAKLVIELDGTQHYMERSHRYDTKRTEYFQRYGLRVLRFSNREVRLFFPGVCRIIDQAIKEHTVDPSGQIKG